MNKPSTNTTKILYYSIEISSYILSRTCTYLFATVVAKSVNPILEPWYFTILPSVRLV